MNTRISGYEDARPVRHFCDGGERDERLQALKDEVLALTDKRDGIVARPTRPAKT
jgi:hypothetical protein